MNYVPKINRRAFVVGSAAGGLALGFGLPTTALATGNRAQFAEDLTPNELGIWVAIKPDDTVAIRVVRAEMGQGSQTGLAQLIAEELDCDWSKVTTEYPTPADNVKRKRAWGNYNATGSRAIRESHQYVREGGAAARLMLIQAAADEWKVPAAECTTDKGVISHKASGKTTSYGKVAAAAAKLPVPEKPKLKDPKDWKIAGKPLQRLDTDRAGGYPPAVAGVLAGLAAQLPPRAPRVGHVPGANESLVSRAAAPRMGDSGGSRSRLTDGTPRAWSASGGGRMHRASALAAG